MIRDYFGVKDRRTVGFRVVSKKQEKMKIPLTLTRAIQKSSSVKVKRSSNDSDSAPCAHPTAHTKPSRRAVVVANAASAV